MRVNGSPECQGWLPEGNPLRDQILRVSACALCHRPLQNHLLILEQPTKAVICETAPCVTPRISATWLPECPSSSNTIARMRRCSSSCPVPLGLIHRLLAYSTTSIGKSKINKRSACGCTAVMVPFWSALTGCCHIKTNVQKDGKRPILCANDHGWPQSRRNQRISPMTTSRPAESASHGDVPKYLWITPGKSLPKCCQSVCRGVRPRPSAQTEFNS